MKIIFKKLEVHNFKGVQDLTIEFNPTLTNVLGANHTGKTTTADAIHWVLFGKSSDGLTVFGIDPKDDENNTIHHLDNSVKLTIEADGREMTLEKVRKETWSKVKGHDEEELTGHTTDCYIDGNKYTVKDYTAEIGRICPESIFRTITNPAYFPSLKAEDQRALLVSMVGERSLEEVAADNDDFKAVLEKLNGEDIKTFRQHLSYQMKELKKNIDGIPSRISENQDIVHQLKEKGTNFDFTRKRIEEIDKGIANYDEQLADKTAIINQNYDKRLQQRKALNELKAKQAAIEEEVDRKNSKAKEDHDKEADECKKQVDSLTRKIANAQQEIDDYSESLQRAEQKIKDFRERWQEVEDEEFKWDETQEICPTCGQRLPEGNIEELKAKAEERFNTQHEKKQDDLDKEAPKVKKAKTDAEALLKDAKERKRDLEDKLKTAKEQYEGAKDTTVETENVTERDDWNDLAAQIREKEDELKQKEPATNEEGNDLDEEAKARQESKQITDKKAELMKKRDALRDELAQENEIKQREKRIEDLERQMKQLNQQLTELEKEDASAEGLQFASIQDLQNRVNEHFKMVRFQMFETKLNGNVTPTCVMTMHGVPYPDLSNSEKINAGIDLINAMSRHNDTYAPITVDNAESVNDVLPSESQQILLIVSRDPQLTVVA